MEKKILITLIAVFTILFAFGIVNVSAETVANGECGDNLTWTLDDGGTLTISGNGWMDTYYGNVPWKNYGSDIIKIVIEDNVENISRFVFSDCINVTSITIPDSIIEIANGAFSGCTKLARVDIIDIEAWCNISFLDINYESISNPLYYAKLYLNNELITDIVLPNGITTISNYAFYGYKELKSISIPDNVTSIGDYAFYGCTGLNKIVIEEGLTSIGGYAFSNCSSLESITIPDSVTSIGDSVFDCCDSLESVTIPDSVTSIGSNAFRDCTGLISAKIGDSVTIIGYSAFSGCDTLAVVDMGTSVKTVGAYAFSGCSIVKVNIKSIDNWCAIDFYPDEYTGYFSSNPLSTGKLFLNGQPVENLVLSNDVTSIGDGAFYRYSDIKSITIPPSLMHVGNNAFYECSGLTKVEITDMVAWCNIDFESNCSNPLSSAGKLYFNGNLLTNIAIPNNVTSIDNFAFYNCDSLESVTIPDSVTSIGEWAFFGCGLKSITIPNSVTSIGEYAFSDCSSLVSATIGKGLDVIPENTFYGSSNLKSVVLTENIKYIRNYAFYKCPNIATVFYTGSESQWNEILLYNGNENLTNAEIVYNATKKTYKFETNCDIALGDMTDYAIFTMPTVQNGGMTLTGWYDNKALSGEPVTFPYYGDATTLYAAWTDRTGKTFDEAFIAKANQEYTVTTTESGQYVYFEFVPNLSKEYRFYTTGNLDTYGCLYDSNQYQLTSDDDDGDGNNFYISYKLTAGQTYYISAKIYSGTGTFTFVVEEPVDYRINEITIKDMSGNSLQAIPTGTFLATVSFTNVSSSADTVIILAQYTDAGAFKGLMYIQTEDVPTGSTIKLSIPVDNSKGDVAKLKAFCWESFASLTPMGNSASFPAE